MLDERKEQILAAIVTDYIQTAVPVGSRTISKNYDIGFSSATIRNEMSDLEELGFIEQPHTSAGRVPTEEGYRYYVSHLMQADNEQGFQEEQRLYEYIKNQVSLDEEKIRAILKQIADVTGYPVALLLPEAQITKPLLSLLELIYLMPERGLIVVITDDERVEQRLIDLPPGFSRQELSVVNGILSHYLRGLSVAHWHRPLIEFLINQMGTASGFVEYVLDNLNDILSRRKAQKIMLEGSLNILSQKEFQSTEKITDLLRAFSDEKKVAGFFKNMPPRGVVVRVGDENSSPVLSDCSMVLSGFCVGKHIGQFGIIGPMRMNYMHNVAMMEAAMRGFEKVYERIERNEVRKNALSTLVSNDQCWSGTELAIFYKND